MRHSGSGYKGGSAAVLLRYSRGVVVADEDVVPPAVLDARVRGAANFRGVIPKDLGGMPAVVGDRASLHLVVVCRSKFVTRKRWGCRNKQASDPV